MSIWIAHACFLKRSDHAPPAGINTFAPGDALGRDAHISMAAAVAYFLKPSSIASMCKNPWRPGPVHRLDKDTEGVQVVAKTRHARGHLMVRNVLDFGFGVWGLGSRV